MTQLVGVGTNNGQACRFYGFLTLVVQPVGVVAWIGDSYFGGGVLESFFMSTVISREVVGIST